MRVPLSWLKQYVDVQVPMADYCEKMVSAGFEIESYGPLRDDIHGVVTARIQKLEKHPDADRLQVCTMDTGDETVQVVTGADNVFEGAIVPLALAGAKLPNGMSIKKGKLRGVQSLGMLCSGEELKLKNADIEGAEVDGILILPEDMPPGVDINAALHLDETVVEFELTANRSDCQCIVGIARETAAVLDQPLTLPPITVTEHTQDDISNHVRVRVDDPESCPRYMARLVKNIRLRPSPEWMQLRLRAAGVRPINNIVDITNYVMLEYGQPMHAFDFNCVQGGQIIVRRAKPGETGVTLDGKTHAFTEEMLLIADQDRAIGIAGVMGGENSEIMDATSTVLFESASFKAYSVRNTMKTLGIDSESALRYSRGIYPYTAQIALERAVELVAELDAGDVVRGVIDVCDKPVQKLAIQVKCEDINNLLGLNLSAGEMAGVLKRLQFSVEIQGNDVMAVTIPPYRADVTMMADIAEEIGRIYGYDHVPTEPLPSTPQIGGLSEYQAFEQTVKQRMCALGFNEAYHFSILGPQNLKQFDLPYDKDHCVAIVNPFGEEFSLMRTGMAPAMMQSVAHNFSRKITDVRLFEVGNTYHVNTGRLPSSPTSVEADGDVPALPEQIQWLCAALCEKQADFYTLKGAVEELCASFNADGLEFLPQGPSYYHPGRKAEIRAGGVFIGHMGEVHPETAKAMDISARVYMAEIDMQALYNSIPEQRKIAELPKYPAVARDIAVLLDKRQMLAPVLACIVKTGGKLLESAQVFDIFSGKSLPEGKKSAAFSLVFRSPERTLTDEEINVVMDRILMEMQEAFFAELRK